MAVSIFTSAIELQRVGESTSIHETGHRMDAMYRYQRHIYDLTRKFYLFGRDQMLRALPLETGGDVLEMGCGTGRNLVCLAPIAPRARIFGMDVSRVMLETAQAKIERRGLSSRIALAAGAGQSFDPDAAFGVPQFDVIYFSYVLSMIPDWQGAVDQAMSLLKPGGVLAVVDFGDQAEVSPWRRWVLLKWLALFDVHPRAEIETSLRKWGASHGALIEDQDILSGYAYLLMLRKPAHSST